MYVEIHAGAATLSAKPADRAPALPCQGRQAPAGRADTYEIPVA